MKRRWLLWGIWKDNLMFIFLAYFLNAKKVESENIAWPHLHYSPEYHAWNVELFFVKAFSGRFRDIGLCISSETPCWTGLKCTIQLTLPSPNTALMYIWNPVSILQAGIISKGSHTHSDLDLKYSLLLLSLLHQGFPPLDHSQCSILPVHMCYSFLGFLHYKMSPVSNYATAAEQSSVYLITIWGLFEAWLLVMKTTMMGISPDLYTEFWLQSTRSESFH